MGHDITAWSVEDEYPVARLRRSGFDDYNLALYRALGAEQHYGHMSGRDTDQVFTRSELSLALRNLPYVFSDGVPGIPQEVRDDVVAQIRQVLVNVNWDEHDPSTMMGETIPNFDIEREFLTKVITWMEQNEQATVRIHFY